MQALITRRLVFVEAEQPMSSVVKTMRDENISSVLVLSREQTVTGIVTERDIVQKFTLLEKQEKMAALVSAFMTRPVQFARLSHIEQDVKDMFFQKRMRHFPVADGSTHERDVLGMLTVTDLTSAYLKSKPEVKHEVKKEPLVVFANDELSRTRYQTLFTSLNFSVLTGDDAEALMQIAAQKHHPIVFDIDNLAFEDTKRYLVHLKKHESAFILLSSQQNLVDPLQKLLGGAKQLVALKPLDISYILRLINFLQEDHLDLNVMS